MHGELRFYRDMLSKYSYIPYSFSWPWPLLLEHASVSILERDPAPLPPLECIRCGPSKSTLVKSL